MPQRGRGRGTRQPPSLDASLSDLLYLERPLLRPVKFVRATHTPFLFQESEEIFQAPSTSNNPAVQSNVPTAERVACIFNNTQSSLPAETISKGETSDELEEIDFADLGTLRARVDAAEHTAQRRRPTLATTGRSQHSFEERAATAGTEHNGGNRGSNTSKELGGINVSDPGTLRGRVDAAERTAQRKTRGDSTTVIMDGTFTVAYSEERPRDTLELSGAKETGQNTTTGEEFAAVATDSNSLRTLEQSIETLQVRENHHVGAFLSERSPQNPSVSEGELGLPKPKNLRFDLELEDKPCLGNVTGESPHVSERAAAAGGTEYNDGGHGFFIDTRPTEPFASSSASDAIAPYGTRRGEILGEEEEIIVYVAPYPRSGRIQPVHDTTPRVKLPSCSLLTGTSETWSASKEPKEASTTGGSPTLSNPQPLTLDAISFDFQRTEPSTHPRFPPAFTPSQKRKGRLRSKAKESRIARHRNARTQFRAFGAMLSESRLRDADESERRDEKWETRRKDDSDIDWGDGDDDAEKSGMRTGAEALVVGDADEPSISEGGMELDQDVDLDVNAMLSFVQSMSADGSRFVTIDDIEDKRRMIEENQDRASTHAVEDSSDEDDSGSCDGSEEDEEEAAVLLLEEQLMIAESDGKDPDDGDALLAAKGPKGSKKNRGAMHSGASVDLSRHVKAKDKADYLPEDLRAQWERDRAKKTENKRLRKQAMMLASLDPSVPKKGGKKARKLMVAALKEMEHVRNDLNDISSIESDIRRFVENIDGRRSMPLLPMMKSTRKIVHELATAFNLKSDSKGHGPGRYITLVKTNRTGIINEGKVKAIMKRATRGSGRYVPSHREGDEVGKEAPAIGDSNVGFKMLASMGWSEGAKIGGDTSVGIEVPLTAVMKKSRLGLGATRT
ncbi:hypothetical protein EDD15DRAFT_2360803 [Pisolithus albus]|nr:hypothetical protein EDD15DRAFT_2360803 [Pisolithus albus]